MDLSSPQNLDPQAVNLAKAIRTTESNGDFTKSNPDVKGWSVGAYQWHGDNEQKARQHFQAEASQFGLDPHDFSPINQDKVAYAKIKSWKDKGYNADEISAMWNGAKMVNGRPVAINPDYVAKVKKNFGGTASPQHNGGLTTPAPNTTNTPGSGLDNYSEIKDTPVINKPGYTGATPDQPQGHGVAGLLTGAATLTGMDKFGAGISTLFDKTSQKTSEDIGKQEGQGQQSIINAIHKETNPTKKQHLINFLKTQYGANYTPTTEELNPAYALKNSDVIKSAGMTALGAISGGSLPEEGMVSGELATGGNPALAKVGVQKGIEASKGLLTKLTPTTKLGKAVAIIAADAVGHQVAKTKVGAAIVKNIPLLKLLLEGGGG